mmetsp:Transcript_6147/g.21609  ORF Transcript_6147/g.21609 Transcript_6147/m.21609 type:complete len:129 (-) Transcript_6147:1054-1440(-)
MPGVVSTRVGYTGGDNPSPTYDTVCAGDGHTEALRVEYDPSETSYEALLQAFFEEHNPTRRSKAQYKSALWPTTDEQKAAAEAMKESLESKHGVKLHTDIEEAKEFWDAEEYHQKYLEKMTGPGWMSW